MTISVGDRIPSMTLTKATAEGPQPVETDDFFAGRKVALFAVPGAFTPTCSNQHLPSFVKNYDKIKAQGVDTIACMAVNDAFVMDAWGKDRQVGDKVKMLGDGSGTYTKALGLEMDGSKFGLGMRGKRFSAIVEDGVVKELNIDEGAYGSTSAEATCHLN